jgi:hypothetical protein
MDNFKVIYKILRYLESLMDCEEFDRSQFTETRFGVSQERWALLLEMLTDEGYIKGLTLQRAADGHVMLSFTQVRLTLAGMTYLQENSAMRKLASAAKGVFDVINTVKP